MSKLIFNAKTSLGHTLFSEINALFTSQLSTQGKSWPSYKSINIDLWHPFLTSTFVFAKQLRSAPHTTLNYPPAGKIILHLPFCLLTFLPLFAINETLAINEIF